MYYLEPLFFLSHFPQKKKKLYLHIHFHATSYGDKSIFIFALRIKSTSDSVCCDAKKADNHRQLVLKQI